MARRSSRQEVEARRQMTPEELDQRIEKDRELLRRQAARTLGFESPEEANQLRADLAAMRERAAGLEGACEKARLVIGKGRCTCTESETAAHILSTALAAPADAEGAGDE
jgi:hypothetical protein